MSTHLPRAVLATVLSLPLTLVLVLGAPPAQAQTADRYADQVRTVTNEKRVDKGRKRLDRGACVQEFAQRQARKMADKEDLFHQDLGPVMRRCNLTMVGENVAYGYTTGRAAVRGWMHSKPHRRNILKRGYRLLGVGVARDNDGDMYSAQVFGRH